MFQLLLSLVGLALLAACGGSGGTDTGASPASVVGTAVDPYIVGAVFQEVTADGTVLQSQSTPSDAQGHFSFSKPLTPGSIVEMKAGHTGLHAGVAYTGDLRRVVPGSSNGDLVVSPLTTVLANGVSPSTLLQDLSDAGFTDLTEADLTSDPMADLSNVTGVVGATRLEPLQAAMAVNALLAVRNNYQLGSSAFTDPTNTAMLDSFGQAMRELVSSDLLTQLAATVSNGNAPLTLGDVISGAAKSGTSIVSIVRASMQNNGGTFDPTMIQNAVSDALAQASTTVGGFYNQRTSGGSSSSGSTATDGATLYANDCASCHGPLATSAKTGATAAQIQSGISSVGAMSSFSSLSSADIQAIADALAPTTSGSTGSNSGSGSSAGTGTTTTDGATLYANDCASCHGPLATSAKAGATAAQIQAGISSVGAMSSLSSLSSADIQAIADALAPTTSGSTGSSSGSGSSAGTGTTTTDGATLYANDCASCHGPLATSAKAGATAAQIQTGISSVGAMSPFSSLSSADIQAIADALAPTTSGSTGSSSGSSSSGTTTTDGATLYANDCASCHGPLATSSITGASASLIQTGISSVSAMSSFSSLSSTDIQAISDALTSTTSGSSSSTGTTTTDGATLYASDCASCHGPLATSSRAGSSASQIQSAINSNTGGMGFLNTLSSTQVQAIASALATVSSGAGSNDD